MGTDKTCSAGHENAIFLYHTLPLLTRLLTSSPFLDLPSLPLINCRENTEFYLLVLGSRLTPNKLVCQYIVRYNALSSSGSEVLLSVSQGIRRQYRRERAATGGLLCEFSLVLVGHRERLAPGSRRSCCVSNEDVADRRQRGNDLYDRAETRNRRLRYSKISLR